jgi:hypothetical protein
LGLVLLTSASAFAQSAPDGQASGGLTISPSNKDTETPPAPIERDMRRDTPLVGFTDSAFGAPARSIGAAAFGGLAGNTVDKTQVAGGGRIWGSPIDRLTIILEAQRTYFGEAAPSITGTVRLFGDHAHGFAGGALLRYKAEGFAELGGEIEGGLLLSVERTAFHLDTNVVFGGSGEEEEADGEFKLRVGYDVGSFVRLGFDGRMRVRVAGQRKLPGDRLGDIIAGPEAVFAVNRFFLSAMGGPSTVGVAKGVGWSTSLTLGAAVL